MKVVLFCGGQGMRLREYSEKIPKPMVPIGYRPILWHIMKYYAHFGYKDFILCLGHQGDTIKDYFVKYNEYVSNDFVLTGGAKVTLLNKDINDWNITFADTGVNANVAQRLLAVRKYLEGEEMFLVNYSDGLSNAPLPDMIEKFKNTDKIGMIMTAKPTRSFHVASIDENNVIKRMTALNKLEDIWINAGYFIFRKEIFDYIDPSADLPEKTFPGMVEREKLIAYPFEGVFLTMDTFKEKQALDDMYAKGDAPWQVWGANGDKTADRSSLDHLNISAR